MISGWLLLKLKNHLEKQSFNFQSAPSRIFITMRL